MSNYKLRRNFETEDFKIDYIGFSFEKFSNTLMKNICNEFFHLGFNAGTIDKKFRDAPFSPILFDSNNKYEVQIILNTSKYWNGVLVGFPGISGLRFYKLAKKSKIKWELFSTSQLNRIDLYYICPIDPANKEEISNFLSDCRKLCLLYHRNVKFEQKTTEWILKIANRRSHRCARIYTGERFESLKFELQLQKNAVKHYKSYFIEHSFEDFEQSLIKEYLNYFKKLISFRYFFVNWFVQKLRPLVYNDRIDLDPFLLTDYMKTEGFILNHKLFVTLLQFLKFTKTLESESVTYDSINYRIVKFKVTDFADVCNYMFNTSSKSTYRVTQVKKCLIQLKQYVLLDIFDNSKFVQLIDLNHIDTNEQDIISGINRLTFSRCPTSKNLLVRAVILEELFLYIYPFRLPDIFKYDKKLSKSDYIVRSEILKIFSSRSIEKKFDFTKLFQNYPASNRTISYRKTEFIRFIKLFYQYNLIEPKAKIILHDSDINIDDMTTRNIHTGFIVYERIL